MGGAGDSSGRSGRVASREPRTAWSCSKKRRRSQSRRRDSHPTVPFPLQEHEGRLQALRTLYEEAGEHRLASEMTALRGLQISHPEMGAEELQCLNNQVLLMIARCFLLVSAVSGPFTSRLAVCICFSWFSHSEVCAFCFGEYL